MPSRPRESYDPVTSTTARARTPRGVDGAATSWVSQDQLGRISVEAQGVCDRLITEAEQEGRTVAALDVLVATSGRHREYVLVPPIEALVSDRPIRRGGRLLLDAARTCGADLLVMGGYGHAPWREAVLGGATQEALSAMSMPLFLMH